MGESKLSEKQLLDVVYQIFIPVKLPGKDSYTLYLQRSSILSMTENRIILNHINSYIPLREFKDYGDNGFEMIFMEPSIIYDNEVEKNLTMLMKDKIRDRFKKKVFSENQLKVLKAHILKINLLEKQPGYKIYTEGGLNFAKAKIYEIMRDVVTSDFGKKMDTVVSYLQSIGVLEEINK